jgi:hypothetical protein
MPVVRLDLTGDGVYSSRLARGPYWGADLRPGHVRPPLGTARRHDGEPWTAMPGWWLAPDVYAALAPTAGVVVKTAADHAPPILTATASALFTPQPLRRSRRARGLTTRRATTSRNRAKGPTRDPPHIRRRARRPGQPRR